MPGPPSPRSVLVTGATGTIGGELLRILSGRGVPVTALSRRPPPASPSGVRWVEADLADRGLVGILEGHERLFLLTGNVPEMVPLQKNAIRAAGEAGVRHVVKLSALGASDHSNSVIGVWHHVTERVLREAGPAWTILRPHVFMQNLLDQRSAIRDDGLLRSPSGDAPIPMVDTRDVAAVAAAVLTEDGHEEKRYTLSGPEAVSHPEAARILAEVLGGPVTFRAESEPEAFERLHRAGQPAWLIGGQLALAAYHRAGAGTAVLTDTVERLTGRPPRSFRRFVEDHVEAFITPGATR